MTPEIIPEQITIEDFKAEPLFTAAYFEPRDKNKPSPTLLICSKCGDVIKAGYVLHVKMDQYDQKKIYTYIVCQACMGSVFQSLDFLSQYLAETMEYAPTPE